MLPEQFTAMTKSLMITKNAAAFQTPRCTRTMFPPLPQDIMTLNIKGTHSSSRRCSIGLRCRLPRQRVARSWTWSYRRRSSMGLYHWSDLRWSIRLRVHHAYFVHHVVSLVSISRMISLHERLPKSHCAARCSSIAKIAWWLVSKCLTLEGELVSRRTEV